FSMKIKKILFSLLILSLKTCSITYTNDKDIVIEHELQEPNEVQVPANGVLTQKFLDGLSAIKGAAKEFYNPEERFIFTLKYLATVAGVALPRILVNLFIQEMQELIMNEDPAELASDEQFFNKPPSPYDPKDKDAIIQRAKQNDHPSS